MKTCTPRVLAYTSTAWFTISMILVGCNPMLPHEQALTKRQQFVSAGYNHFVGGVLFTDVSEGLRVLWEASFRYGAAYKENVAFLTHDGLIIAPNKANTLDQGKLSTFPMNIDEGKLLITVGGDSFQVLAIVHTHPDPASLPTPAPRHDYQFAYMGIHNYIIGHHYLFDAYKDTSGNELFDRITWKNSDVDISLLRFIRHGGSDVVSLRVAAGR